MDPTIWTQVIRPCAQRPQRVGLLHRHPKGQEHLSTASGPRQKDDPDWTRLILKASETGLLDHLRAKPTLAR
jgi:hypothetical protein